MRHRLGTNDTAALAAGQDRRRRWRRVGLLGGLFFLVKGLLWLLLPALWMMWTSIQD